MTIHSTPLEGLKIIETNHFQDIRGTFHKFFSEAEFNEFNIDTDFKESYYSINKKNVIRGMHFQVPPADHAKLVYVTSGKIRDVCLDIRKDSPTYGQYFAYELSADVASCLYIPSGFAHGFVSLEDDSCVHYLQTSCYDKSCDCGIRYDSFGYDWQIENPVVSERDLMHPAFQDFSTSFTGKKVVVTGATGLIGKETIEPLKKAGFQVYKLATENCNLFDYGAVDSFMKHVKAEYLLHFAWITGGDYLRNPANEKYMEASMNLLQAFKKYGGRRVVVAGTCFEYSFKEEPLKENDALKPVTLYARCKVDLFHRAQEWCSENDVSFGWGRIFSVYGHNEKEGRLTTILTRALEKNETFTVRYGQLVRDYMYSRDVAAAFVAFLTSGVEGAVNICSGKGISLKDFSMLLAEGMHKEKLLIAEENSTPQPLHIVGDNTRLVTEVGYRETTGYAQAIKNILENLS